MAFCFFVCQLFSRTPNAPFLSRPVFLRGPLDRMFFPHQQGTPCPGLSAKRPEASIFEPRPGCHKCQKKKLSSICEWPHPQGAGPAQKCYGPDRKCGENSGLPVHPPPTKTFITTLLLIFLSSYFPFRVFLPIKFPYFLHEKKNI